MLPKELSLYIIAACLFVQTCGDLSGRVSENTIEHSTNQIVNAIDAQTSAIKDNTRAIEKQSSGK